MEKPTEFAPAALADHKPPVHLRVENLRVRYRLPRGYLHAVDDISFEVPPGQSLGLVGESGCGKSTVAKAVLRLLPDDAGIDGRILLDDTDVLGMSSAQLRSVRWTKLALVTQSAMNSLDPVYRVGDQIVESIRAHEDVGKREAWERAEELFTLVGIPAERLADYPHQFSGGMRQRGVIAMALSLNAGLLVADEPTTALDSIMQDQVLAQVRRLQKELSRSMILVTHDMGVVAETCQSLAVMYAGRIIEKGPIREVLTRPFHPYTMGLRNAFPRLGGERQELISIPGNLPNLIEPPHGCRFAARCPFVTSHCVEVDPPLVEVGEGHVSACHYPDRADEFRARAEERRTWEGEGAAIFSCGGSAVGGPGEAITETTGEPAPAVAASEPVVEVTGLRKHFTLGGGILASALGRPGRVVKALDGVDFSIRRGEVFGLVGGSGSGKSTLGMTLVRLHRPTEGMIRFEGKEITRAEGAALKAYRSDAQIIFQDPYGSLNPRLTVGQVVEEPLKVHGVRDRGERAERVVGALERVLLPPGEYLHRYPHELSGGQRQRIAIARAIVLEPKFVVADEPVSMLDVSVQAGVLELLARLSREMGLAVLYVSHDIATVRYICDRVAVMHLGEFVEYGDARKVTSHPAHPYTRRLMAAVPSIDPEEKKERLALLEATAAADEPCGEDEPHWMEIEPDHFVACSRH